MTTDQDNQAENGGKVNALQRGNQTVQDNTQHVHVHPVDAEQVIAAIRQERNEALIQVGRAEHQVELLTTQIAAATARIAELESTLGTVTSEQREQAARGELLATIRTSFGKIRAPEKGTYFVHTWAYQCLGCTGQSHGAAYLCAEVDTFLQKVYGVVTVNPAGLLNYLATLTTFPQVPSKYGTPAEGYCIREIDTYISAVREAARTYLSQR